MIGRGDAGVALGIVGIHRAACGSLGVLLEARGILVMAPRRVGAAVGGVLFNENCLGLLQEPPNVRFSPIPTTFY